MVQEETRRCVAESVRSLMQSSLNVQGQTERNTQEIQLLKREMHELKVMLGAAEEEGEQASIVSQNDIASPVGEEERAQ